MKLSSVWHPFQTLSDYEATRDELAEKWAESVRTARLEVARNLRNWTEVEETALIPRGRYLVHFETDEIFTLRRGEVFEPGRASVGYVSDSTQLHYFVDQAGDVVFVERQRGTWSDIVARKARRGAA